MYMSKKIYILLFVLGLFAPAVSLAGHSNPHSIQQLETQINTLRTQISGLETRISGLNTRISELRGLSSVSNANFTFSHNEGTLVAGVDRWTMSLTGGTGGDRLTVKAWKNDVPVNNGAFLDICTVERRSQGCSRIGRPTIRNDLGHWRETVFINGVEKGTISFEVVRTQTTTSPAPTVIYYGCVEHQCTVLPQNDSRVHWFGPSGLSSCRITCEDGSTFPPPTYSFAGPLAGTDTMIAGRESWTYTLSSAKPRDILYVRAWKNGIFYRKLIICRVESNAYHCSKSVPVTAADIGEWEGEVGYTRDGVDSVLGERGAVRFRVINAGGATRFDFKSGFSSIFRATTHLLFGNIWNF